jgi:hypothetical protein
MVRPITDAPVGKSSAWEPRAAAAVLPARRTRRRGFPPGNGTSCHSRPAPKATVLARRIFAEGRAAAKRILPVRVIEAHLCNTKTDQERPRLRMAMLQEMAPGTRPSPLRVPMQMVDLIWPAVLSMNLMVWSSEVEIRVVLPPHPSPLGRVAQMQKYGAKFSRVIMQEFERKGCSKIAAAEDGRAPAFGQHALCLGERERRRPSSCERAGS